MNNNLLQLSGVDLVVPTHGLEGAKSYPMGPNCRVPLFDDSDDIFYIKSTDSNGFPTVKQYRFKEEILIDKSNGNGVVLDDIRALIREELTSVIGSKEMISNGQQFVSAANSEPADRNESGNTTVNKHNGNAKSNASGSASNGKQRQNSSVVEHHKEQ